MGTGGLAEASLLPGPPGADYAYGLAFTKMKRSPHVQVISNPDCEPVACPGLHCSGPVPGTEPSKRYEVARTETCPDHQGVFLGLCAVLFFNTRVTFCHGPSFP